jgi:Leucine-rich repeat (LRR) protein
LKRIDLSDSQNLIETPDLSEVPNLETLNLKGCRSLSKVHPSIGILKQLTWLHLYGCSSLEKIPNIVGNITSLRYLNLQGTAIEMIPPSFKGLTSLLSLDISNCSRLEKIPENLLSGMECLDSLHVDGRELPIGSGPNTVKSLLLPNSLSSLRFLRKLDFSYCNLSDEAIPSDLSCLPLLDSLRLSGNKFTRIPDSVAQLSGLITLELDECIWLQVLPKLPLQLENLYISNCPSLELFYKQMDMWRTSNEKLRRIDSTFVQVYIDCDGKPFKMLHLHPRSALWTEVRESTVSLLLISFLTH